MLKAVIKHLVRERKKKKKPLKGEKNPDEIEQRGN